MVISRQGVGLVLGPALFSILLMLPVPEGMTPQALNVAAIAALMAVWWMTEAIPIPATSLLPIVLYPVLGIMPSSEATQPYGNHLIYLFLGGFLLAIAMETWNLHKRIALHTIRLVGVGPDRIILGFMVATAFLSMWVSNTATTMMMVPIGLAVIKQATGVLERNPIPGVETGVGQFRFGVSLMLGICYSASIGGVGTLIGTPPNVVLAGMAEKLYQQRIGFAEWMLFGLPLVVVMLAATWFILTRFIYPPGIKTLPGGKELIRSELQQLGAITSPEKRVLVIFSLTAFCWVARGFVSPPMINDSTIAIAGALLLFLTPAGVGERRFILTWEDALKLPWGVVLLFGGGLALADGFASTGLTAWIGNQLSELNTLDLMFFIGVVVFMTIFLTEITSNTATATLLIPVMGAVAVSMEVHPFGPMFGAAIAASFAFMLPVATPPNAVVYGSGYVSIGQMAMAGLVFNLIGVVLVTASVLYLLPMVWSIDLVTLPAWAIKQ